MKWQPKFAAYNNWPLKSRREARREQAIMEMTGEAAEVLQVATKARRKSIDIPRDKIVDELGDTFWGLVGVMNEFEISFDELTDYNHNKLEERFKDK